MGLSAWITFANLGVFLVVAMFIMGDVKDRGYHDARIAVEEVGHLMFIAAMAQIAATGLLLTAWKPGRRVGLGLIVGALAALAGLTALVFLVVLTVGS